jgi:hypothetical protein
MDIIQAIYTWGSILKARLEIIDTQFYGVGDGREIRIWEDNWLLFQQGHIGIGPPNLQTVMLI